MVKKNQKGGVAFIDTNSSCNNLKICNLSDAKYATDYYHPADFNKLDDKPTFFALPNNILGGKKNLKKGGSNIPVQQDLYDTKNLNYNKPFSATDYNNLDDRSTNFALSASYFGGKSNTTFSKKQEKTLKYLFFKLLEKSYLNYKSSITYKGGDGNLDANAIATFNTSD